MSRRLAASAVAAAVVLLASCAERVVPPPRAPAPRPTVQRPPRPAPPVAALSPAALVATLASFDLLAIRSGELARTRARQPRLRAFADRLTQSHLGTAAQLSLAGRRLNLLPRAELLPSHQAMLDQLAASGDFDSAYRRQQLRSHQQAVQVLRAFAARGSSPTLRQLATRFAVTEAGHLASLRQAR